MNDDLENPAGSVEPVTAPDLDPVAPVPAETDDAPASKKHALPFWLELPLLIIAALAIAVVIKTFFFQAFWIPSSSMEDTLLINDRVMVNKLAYRFGDLQRGHVVVFDDPRGDAAPQETLLEATRRNITEAIGLSVPRTEFIKRVIGLPGERVEIIDNQVLIDGVPIDEPYLKTGSAHARLRPGRCAGGRDVRDGRQPELEPGQPLLRVGVHRHGGRQGVRDHVAGPSRWSGL